MPRPRKKTQPNDEGDTIPDVPPIPKDIKDALGGIPIPPPPVPRARQKPRKPTAPTRQDSSGLLAVGQDVREARRAIDGLRNAFTSLVSQTDNRCTEGESCLETASKAPDEAKSQGVDLKQAATILADFRAVLDKHFPMSEPDKT